MRAARVRGGGGAAEERTGLRGDGPKEGIGPQKSEGRKIDFDREIEFGENWGLEMEFGYLWSRANIWQGFEIWNLNFEFDYLDSGKQEESTTGFKKGI